MPSCASASGGPIGPEPAVEGVLAAGGSGVAGALLGLPAVLVSVLSGLGVTDPLWVADALELWVGRAAEPAEVSATAPDAPELLGGGVTGAVGADLPETAVDLTREVLELPLAGTP